MPLFFFLSGYVQKWSRHNLKKFIKNEINRLLYPYYTIGFLIILFNTFCDFYESHFVSTQMLLKRVLALMWGNCIWENNTDYINTLWFLVALFSVKIISVLIMSINNERMKFFLIILLSMFGCFWRDLHNLGIRLPFCFDIALIATFFYMLGVYVNVFEYLLRKRVLIFKQVIVLIMGSFLAFLNCYISNIQRTDIYGMQIGNPILFYLSSSLTIISLLCLTRNLTERFGRSKLFALMERTGKLSLLIMAFHLHVYKVIHFILSKFIYKGQNVFLIAMTVFAITYILSVFVERYFPCIYKRINNRGSNI